jgi:hypothetical protein
MLFSPGGERKKYSKTVDFEADIKYSVLNEQEGKLKSNLA